MTTQRIIPIRASSFGTLFDCSLRFEGEQILKLVKRSSLRAWLGTSIHAGTAAFDQAKIDGSPISVSDAGDVMMDLFLSPNHDVNLRDESLSLKEAQRIALHLLARYCTDISPQFKFIGVEQKLEPYDIDCGDGLVIRLTGSMDRARAIEALGGDVVADIKSGSRLMIDGQVSVKGRAAQTGTYQILKENTDGRLTVGSQIIGLQTSSAPQVGISKIFDAKKIVLGDPATPEVPGLLEVAAKMFKAGLFPPNPASVLCDKRYCARWSTCTYHE